MNSKRLLLLLAALVALVVACGGGDAEEVGSPTGGGQEAAEPAASASQVAVEVSVKDMAYKPAHVTATKGEAVSWVFEDGNIPHNVVADDGSFESKPSITKGTYSHTFLDPGRFSYICTIHPNMKGTVTVT